MKTQAKAVHSKAAATTVIAETYSVLKVYN